MEATYLMARNVIADGIHSGRWQAGTQLPPLPALASSLGFSRWATERALNMLIQEGMLCRRPKKGTFVSTGLVLAAKEALPIALIGISPERWMSGAYAGPLMRALGVELKERDWFFLQLQQAEKLILRLRSIKACSLIAITPNAGDIPLLKQVAEEGINVLCIGGLVTAKELHNICVDNTAGIHEAARHLVSLGHRHIAYFGYHCNSLDHGERLEAFQQAIARYHLDANPLLITFDEADVVDDSCIDETLARWRDLAKPPTAIISSGCGLTVPLIKGLARLGVEFPRHISLLAFDDLSLATHLASPLTVIRQPLQEMGMQAGQAISALENGASARIALRLKPTLVIRKSCAAVAPETD